MAVTDRTFSAMKKHAALEYPREACGLVVKKARSEVYVPCKNVADKPEDNFKICPYDYAEADEMGEIVGVFHSHPDGTSAPSTQDLACMSVNAKIQRSVAPDSPLVPWYILSWPDGDYREVMPTIHDSILGRPFVHGVWDCWQTCNDYYEKYHGLKFPKYQREDAWWEVKDGPSHYEDLYEAAGFYVVAGESLQVGDLLIMEIGRTYHPNHAGVYLGKVDSFEGVAVAGNGPFLLHHLYGRDSNVVVFGGQWEQRVRFVLRHKEVKNV